MPFASKENATGKNGKLKKGFKMITTKDGKTRYMSEYRKPMSKEKTATLALEKCEEGKTRTGKKTPVSKVKRCVKKDMPMKSN